MKRYIALCLVAAVLPPLTAFGAGDAAPAVDTSHWKCSYCPFPEGWSGALTLDLGNVSQDSRDFGHYNGLDQKGLFLNGGGDADYFGKDGKYWYLHADDLGLDSRSLSVEGGTQGHYSIGLDYHELTTLGPEDARTPYRISGTNLTLPAGWVQAPTTGGMTSLPSALHDFPLEQDRKHLALNFDLIAKPGLEYSVTYRRETKQGLLATGGAILFNSVILPEPVDYATDIVQLKVAYQHKAWSTQFTYKGSIFHDNNTSMTWQNPYSPTLGAVSGRMSQPPSNQFHQVAMMASYRFSPTSLLFADLALGRGTQDEGFVPYTINGSITTTALPRSNADAQVDTLNAMVRYTARPTAKIAVNAEMRVNDRNNKTPQATYSYVATDALLAGTQTNLPYGFKDRYLRFNADYSVNPRSRVGLGVEHQEHEHTYDLIAKSKEDAVWLKLSHHMAGSLDTRLKLSYANRGVDRNDNPPALLLADNPLLTKFSIASRRRGQAQFSISGAPSQRVQVAMNVAYNKDQYTDTSIGLLDDNTVDASLDATFVISDALNMHAFYSHERVNSNQAGSDSFSTPDWRGVERDDVDTVGFGLHYAPEERKYDLGADLTFSRSAGLMSIEQLSGTSQFPRLRMALDRARLYGNYRVRKNLDATAQLIYERGKANDWALDGVAPNTIPNVLALGSSSPDYNVVVAIFGVRYHF